MRVAAIDVGPSLSSNLKPLAAVGAGCERVGAMISAPRGLAGAAMGAAHLVDSATGGIAAVGIATAGSATARMNAGIAGAGSLIKRAVERPKFAHVVRRRHVALTLLIPPTLRC